MQIGGNELETTQDNASQQIIRGYLFALAATAIWSGNFIVARGLSEHIPPVSLAFYRWLTAVLVFTPFALKGLVREWVSVRKHLWYFSITSFLGVTCFNTFIYIAGHTTTATNLALIAISFPVFIILLGRIFFKEVVSPGKLFGVALVLLGVICLITRGELSSLKEISFTRGDLWMLAASVIFAVYSILLKNKPADISLFSLQFTCFILGLAFLLPFYLWEQIGIQDALLTWTTVPAILYVGIFASLTAFLFWNRAIVILGPSRAGMVYYTLPLFSGALGVLFLGETLSLIHLVSLLLIISGILFTNQADRRKNGK